MDSNKFTDKILAEIEYATLATVDQDGNPWNTPVYCAIDSARNVYWSSHPESQHSKNIALNGKVFVAIYNSKAKAGEGQGVYMEASAQALTGDSEIQEGLDLLGARRGRSFTDIQKFKSSGPQRIYKARPANIWINDADQDDDGDFIRDYRIEVVS